MAAAAIWRRRARWAAGRRAAKNELWRYNDIWHGASNNSAQIVRMGIMGIKQNIGAHQRKTAWKTKA